MNFLSRLAFVLTLLLAISLPVRADSPENDVKKMVESFYKDYYKAFVTKEPKGNYEKQVIQWVDRSPACSPAFKKALAKAFIDARKRDPELGLEVDPILAGQDRPDKGYLAKTIKITKDKAAVTMVGVGGGDFHISLRVVNINGQWQIDRIADIPAK